MAEIGARAGLGYGVWVLVDVVGLMICIGHVALGGLGEGTNFVRWGCLYMLRYW